MYKFVDTTERQEEQILPSEALNFNGVYFENVIPGYRTLYVSGREMIETEITDLDTEIMDGSRYRRKRYKPRTITVGHQLIAKSNAEFRNAYNKLNSLLDVAEAKLIFLDEPDKYYVGTKVNAGMRSLQKLSSIAQIHLNIPWKSTKLRQLQMTGQHLLLIIKERIKHIQRSKQ